MQSNNVLAVTLDNERRLYVIQTDGGYSCLGFDVLAMRMLEIERVLGITTGRLGFIPTKDKPALGALELYSHYRRLLRKLAGKYPGGYPNTWFPADAPQALCNALEAARVDRTKVRIWSGDLDTGRPWLDDCDVLGKIGRSTGLMKIPLLVEAGACGGGGLLVSNILRIASAPSGVTLYQHPGFTMPQFTLQSSSAKTYRHEVLAYGQVQARFNAEGKALAWIEFMLGRRFSY